VNDATLCPVLYVLQILAEERQKWVIYDFDVAGRRQLRNETRNAVHGLPQGELGLTQHFLGAFSVVDVSQEEIPRGYLTFRIPRRAATRLEPSVRTISAPTTQLNIADLARFE
jgi:hypothetical protein